MRYVQNITLLVGASDRHLFWMHLIAETLMFGLGLFFVLKLVSTLLVVSTRKPTSTAAKKRFTCNSFSREPIPANALEIKLVTIVLHEIFSTLLAIYIGLPSGFLYAINVRCFWGKGNLPLEINQTQSYTPIG